MDAYLIAKKLPEMRANNHYSVQGETGQLSVNNHCVVQREMDWGKFSSQGITPLTATHTPTAPLSSTTNAADNINLINGESSAQ